MKKEETELLEKLAALEHEQWMFWAKYLIRTENLSQQTVNRWNSYFIPYSDLPDNIKELDRVYARKVVEALKSNRKKDGVGD